MYNFDEEIDRWGTACEKWDGAAEEYGREILPMWVADMDFPCPNPVKNAILERAEHPVYGYTYPSPGCVQAITEKFKRENGWLIQPEWIVFTHGVVDGIHSAIRGITEPGDSVLIQKPVYYPFFSVIEDNQCNMVNNPLVIQDGRYEIDFEDLEQKLKNGVKAFLFCSPHNPVGRVWSREELLRVSQLCQKYHCILLSDEIHCDIVFEPYRHTVLASLDEQVLYHSISFFSISKTYNTPGLTTAFAVIPDEGLRKKFLKARMGQNGGNMFGYTAVEAAYNSGGEYRRELLTYLKGNIDYFIEKLEEKLPMIKAFPPQGTYLVWVDLRAYGYSLEELRDKFVKECRLILDEGTLFGEEGAGFYRFNLACPRTYVEQALLRMYSIFPADGGR